MVRPIVLVFQEFAEQTATPTTPDLNCLILGPAYQLEDYPEDKDVLNVSDYGTLHAPNPYSPPTANLPAITLAAPPNIQAGAWVVPDSVRVFFDEAQVILADGSDGVTVTSAPNENLFSSASATFETDGIQAGDTLIVDEPDGSGSLVLTVQSVDSETTLRVSSNFSDADTGLNYRVERTLEDQEVSSDFIGRPTFRSSNEVVILGGVEVPVNGDMKTVAYAKVYVAYRAFRTDLQGLDTVNSFAEITTKLGEIDARNPLAVGVSVARQNSGSAPVQFYGVDTQDLQGYNRALDEVSTIDSVYAMVPLITDLNVVASYRNSNEQFADPNEALSNGVPQKFRVVIGSSELPEVEEVTDESTNGTSEQLSGATPTGIRTIDIDGVTFQTAGVRPGDRLVVSASIDGLDGTYTVAHINGEEVLETDEPFPAAVSTSGINYRVVRPSSGVEIIALSDNRAHFDNDDVRYVARHAGVSAGSITIALIQSTDTPDGINRIVEVPGTSTEVHGDFTSTNITAQQIADAINTGAGVTLAFSGSENMTAEALNPATAQTATAATALSTTQAGINSLNATTALDAVFIRLFDNNATFLSDGVIAGDTIEIPLNPNGVFSGETVKYTVNQVLSEQRLEIENIVAGEYQNNTSTEVNELPHLDNRLGTGTNVTQGSIRYRVIRELTKDQQVAELVSQAQSLNSRRAILAWPDRVEVAGLTDGSKDRLGDGSFAPADPQPGYMLASVIGGMTAGLPSHQGFSRLGVAGISRIRNSSDHFTERQLTQLSDGGWYVFAQATPTSLPHSIHQLTTDPSTLESGEYSIVKNFDFVSLFFLDILESFLGVWNINNDTLGFIRQAVNTGIENLKLRRVAKIGAPINDATITSIEVSEAAADRVEIFVEVDLPKPLNVIGLHLVA
jgi:hypothetical protein